MKLQAHRILLALIACLGAAEPAGAQGSIPTIGLARGTSPDSTCLEPLGPDQAELFVRDYFQPSGRAGEIRTYSIDGAANGLSVDWDPVTGAWQAIVSEWCDVTITHYPRPAVAPMTEHHGMVLLDSEALSGDFFLETNGAVEIPAPVMRQRAAWNALSWLPLPLVGSDGACQLAGEAVGPVIVGWNVYRLPRAVLPPAFSTPEHYLCGPDGDCASGADNGFVAHVPNTPSIRDGLVHFADDGLPLDPALADHVYVIQPVQEGVPTGDANADTIPDMDLNGDGIPEFVDPSGVGRGLTGRVDGPGGFTKPILVSTDSFTSKDAQIYIHANGGSHLIAWDAVGAAIAPLWLDLHAGFLEDLRDPVLSVARDRLACDWPDGPAARPLPDPNAGAGNRYYLMSVGFRAPDGRIVEEYGADSTGALHLPTTTPPPCR